MAKKVVICKSCQVECESHGNELTCPKCGTTFVRQGDEVKVKEIGRLDRIENDLAEIKKRLPTQEPEPPAEPEPEPEENEDEEDW